MGIGYKLERVPIILECMRKVAHSVTASALYDRLNFTCAFSSALVLLSCSRISDWLQCMACAKEFRKGCEAALLEG